MSRRPSRHSATATTMHPINTRMVEVSTPSTDAFFSVIEKIANAATKIIAGSKAA